MRSSVVLEPSQACPVSGSYIGSADDFLGMEVDVAVSHRPVGQQKAASPVAMSVIAQTGVPETARLAMA